MRMKKVNIVIAVILILFGLFYAYLTINLPDRNLPNTLGSSFMPWLLVSCLFGLSLLLLLQTIIKGSAETCDYQISIKEGAGIFWLSIIVIGYIYSLDFIGFLLATPVFLAILMLLTGARSWKQIAVTSTAVTIGIYLFFQKVFQIILPAGEIF